MTNAFNQPMPLKNLSWDPLSENDNQPLSTTAAKRLKRDLMAIFTEPVPGILVVPDELNLRLLHILIIGPSDTPYDGGLFYFILKCPTDYPMRPPKMKLMTTDGGRVRFNPNFYSCGKICVSILGTWSGPCWTPVTNLTTLLVTIQSLMNKNSLKNEPNISTLAGQIDFKLYDKYITHETLRVAVCGMVENECLLNIPKEFKKIIDETFINYYHQYVDLATSYMHMNGNSIMVPYFGNNHTFHFDQILERLHVIYDKISKN